MESMDGPEIPILLLGDAEVGKSTFLSRIALGSTSKNVAARLPVLRNLDQPFPFRIRMYNRPYTFLFSDTSSPENYTLLQPSVLVVCYDISNPSSLASIKTRWRREVDTHFNVGEKVPVVLLGLKRDVREKEDYNGSVRQAIGPETGDTDGGVLNPRTFVYPQEGLGVAQEMRWDRYCECSALTGELCREVIEDIARTAAKTTTEKGGRSDGTSCSVM
ncbi:hypothetical protein MBLNU230_g7820t1 [Neophaeotheca triangularis]